MVNINVRVKQIGKKYPLKEISINLSELGTAFTLEALIQSLVKYQVELFINKKKHSFDEPSEAYEPLSDETLFLLAQTGKIGFNIRYDNKKISTEASINVALQAFSDNLYAVFHGEEQIENLSDIIDITNINTFSFIKLTFLAGRLW